MFVGDDGEGLKGGRGQLLRAAVEDEALYVGRVGLARLEPVTAGDPRQGEAAPVGLVARRERTTELLHRLDGHFQQFGKNARRHGLGGDGQHRLDGGCLRHSGRELAWLICYGGVGTLLGACARVAKAHPP